MNVAIIGATSFLAQELTVWLLNNKHTVHLFGRNSPHNSQALFTILDLDTPIAYEQFNNFDVIFNCLASGVQSNHGVTDIETYQINTFFPITLCEKLTESNYKGILINFGSYFEIGNNTLAHSFDEIALQNSKADLPNAYCRSKKLLTTYLANCNLNFLNYHFILPTIYGEKEAKHRLIPYLVENAKKNHLPELSDGDQTRQYLYVGDAVLILERLLEADLPSGIYNFPSAETATIRQITERIFAAYGKKIPSSCFGKICKNDAGMRHLQLCTSKLASFMGSLPLTSLEDNLNRYSD